MPQSTYSSRKRRHVADSDSESSDDDTPAFHLPPSPVSSSDGDSSDASSEDTDDEESDTDGSDSEEDDSPRPRKRKRTSSSSSEEESEDEESSEEDEAMGPLPQDVSASDADSEDEESFAAKNTFFRDKIAGLLTADHPDGGQSLVESMYDNASSDSEEEADAQSDPDAARQALRQHRTDELSAVARTAFPLTDSEKDDVDALQAARKADYTDRTGKQRVYREETQQLFHQRGQEMAATNMYHNTFLRRAFRAAIPRASALSSNSSEYNKRQGDIRDELQKVLQTENDKHTWTEDDFEDPDTWKVVQHMLEKPMSNPSSAPVLHEHLDDDETDKATMRSAFHHIGWKESLGGTLSQFALNPLNLTVRHDTRESRNNPSRMPGAHEFDHQTMGFKTGSDLVDAARSKGGHFKAIDAEAAYYGLKPIAQERLHKADIMRKKGRSEEDDEDEEDDDE